MLTLNPTEQKNQAIKEIKLDEDKLELYLEKNGQDIKSETTIRKIRTKALALQDLDPDDIKDLELLKKLEEEDFQAGNKYAKNIRNINLSPFAVCAFNTKQFEVLVNEKRNKGELTGHCDASGGVVRKPKNVKTNIFYYPFTIPIMPDNIAENGDESNCRILPFNEMVGGAHVT